MTTMEVDQQALYKKIAQEMGLGVSPVENVIQLLGEGNTVPFIARYRKELTGSMDEVRIQAIGEQWEMELSLVKRKQDVLRLIAEQEKLTPELVVQIEKATRLQELEDLYRPYRPKRKTRASEAKEKGLEPLAQWLLAPPEGGDPRVEAARYISEERGVADEEAALKGAQDILAEGATDDPQVRTRVRELMGKKSLLKTEVKKDGVDEKKRYASYYEYEEPVSRIPSHRVLAINRGEKEEVLRVHLEEPQEECLSVLYKKYLPQEDCVSYALVKEALEDGYKRLLLPALTREIRNELTLAAQEQAMQLFSQNLRSLLLQPPLKDRVIMGIDPGYRTGCKVGVVDATGKLLVWDVIYPTVSKNRVEAARTTVARLVADYGVEIIAIGNGTASRETEQFVAETIKELPGEVGYIIVDEAGASVYSASKIAREEFPDLQVEERSAVSIARRLQDPLSELVKIDPKAIGVGQYQHDMPQQRLQSSLGFVVETAVNQVGVNVNTASSSLLQYVAGLNKTVVQNIIQRRNEKGPFRSRLELKTVEKLGAKTFEQCVGFLRIAQGENKLDQTAIHPESYGRAMSLLTHIGCSVEEIGSQTVREKLAALDVSQASTELSIPKETLLDIVENLKDPGRDVREDIVKPVLRTDVMDIKSLEVGMELQGTVRNVVDFGAFVDVGVKQSGLVHISKMADRFIRHPSEVVAVGDIVTVWVEAINLDNDRISLTMRPPLD